MYIGLQFYLVFSCNFIFWLFLGNSLNVYGFIWMQCTPTQAFWWSCSPILHPFTSLHIRLHLGLELTGMHYITFFLHFLCNFCEVQSYTLLHLCNFDYIWELNSLACTILHFSYICHAFFGDVQSYIPIHLCIFDYIWDLT